VSCAVRYDEDLAYGGFESTYEREEVHLCGVSYAEREVVRLACEADEEALADCDLPLLKAARDALDVCRLEHCDNHADVADYALQWLEAAIRTERARLEAIDEQEADAEGPDCCHGAGCRACLGVA
jgi:hypothetical protein